MNKKLKSCVMFCLHNFNMRTLKISRSIYLRKFVIFILNEVTSYRLIIDLNFQKFYKQATVCTTWSGLGIWNFENSIFTFHIHHIKQAKFLIIFYILSEYEAIKLRRWRIRIMKMGERRVSVEHKKSDACALFSIHVGWC